MITAIGCTYIVRSEEHVVVHVEPAFELNGHLRAPQVVTRNTRGDLTTWWEDEFLRVATLAGRQSTHQAKGTYIGRFDYTFKTLDGEDHVTLDVYADWGLITKDMARKLRGSKSGKTHRVGGALRANRRMSTK